MYIHTPTNGYPDNVDLIVSEEGYGKNSYSHQNRKAIEQKLFNDCLKKVVETHPKWELDKYLERY